MSKWSEILEAGKMLAPAMREGFNDLLKSGRYSEAMKMVENTAAKEASPMTRIARNGEELAVLPKQSEPIALQQEVHPQFEEVQPAQKAEISPTAEATSAPETKPEMVPSDTPVSKPPEYLAADTESPGHVTTDDNPTLVSESTPKAISVDQEVLPSKPALPPEKVEDIVDRASKLPEKSPLLTKKSKNMMKIAVPLTGAAAVGAAMMGGGEQSNQAEAMSSETRAPASVPPSNNGDAMQVKGQVSPSGMLAGQLAYDLSKGQGTAAPQHAVQQPPHPAVTDALSKMLNFEDNGQQSGMADALAKQNDAIHDAKMNRYLNLIGSGIARLPTDNVESEYQRNLQESGLPIQQYEKINADKENDPRSGISAGMRDYLKTMGVNVSDNATASQMKQVVPYIFKDVEAKQAQSAKHEDTQLRYKELAQNRRASDQRHQEASDMVRQRYEESRSDKLDKKADKAKEDFYNKYNSFRGNTSVQRASEALRNSESAMMLLKDKKDFNEVDPQEYNLFTAEIAKIAQGGAATESSLHDVRAKTFMSQAATWWQKVGGKPTPAELGAFIQKNRDYLLHLDEVNHKYVDQFHAETYRGFRNSLRPEDREEYETRHPEVMQYYNNQGKQTSTPHQSDATTLSSPSLGFDSNAAAQELARRRKQ